MWIYEHKDWPNFTWDSKKLSHKLADIRYHQGLLLGKLKTFGFKLKIEATLETLTSETVKSSAIEGEILNSSEVRSSIARHLGIDIVNAIPSSRNVDGIVEMMLDATQNFSKPLTKKRLFNWHSALFPTGRSGINHITVSNWRTANTGPMQVVSGPIGKEKIHFEAPNANTVEKEITTFIKWFEHKDNTDPVLKAGIAHLWFITIHPFEDGNGRIARAITDMALARADEIPERFYSLSTQIETNRKSYYNQLEKQQCSTPEITSWLEWFLDCLDAALSNAETTLSNVIFKAELWKKINRQSTNERQQLIISKMMEDDFEGYMNTSKYAKLAKCSQDTALRDIQDLKAKGILIQNPNGGRSTSYRLP